MPEKLLGYLFSTLTTYMYKKKRQKYLHSSHVDGKREIACFHVETATGKWREKRGHVVIFAVRVSRIRDAKPLYYICIYPFHRQVGFSSDQLCSEIKIILFQLISRSWISYYKGYNNGSTVQVSRQGFNIILRVHSFGAISLAILITV